VTREQCNYTITGLKAVFPVALATACPIGRIRNYMQRSLDHVRALLKIGRNGDFSLIPSLRKLYKSHRRSELINLGLASDVQKRKRGEWGSIAHARLKTPEERKAAEAVLEVGEAAIFAGDLIIALKKKKLLMMFPIGELMDVESVFDDDLTVLPVEAVAACAAAFAEVAAEAEAEEERDLEIALGEPEVRGAERPPRTEGYNRAMFLRVFDADQPPTAGEARRRG
jgi:hypothetical protein